MTQSASAKATISPFAFIAPSFRAPPTLLLVWTKTMSARGARDSRVRSFELPSTTMILVLGPGEGLAVEGLEAGDDILFLVECGDDDGDHGSASLLYSFAWASAISLMSNCSVNRLALLPREVQLRF